MADVQDGYLRNDRYTIGLLPEYWLHTLPAVWLRLQVALLSECAEQVEVPCCIDSGGKKLSAPVSLSWLHHCTSCWCVTGTEKRLRIWWYFCASWAIPYFPASSTFFLARQADCLPVMPVDHAICCGVN